MTTADLDLPAPDLAALPRMTEDEFVAWAFANDVRAEWVDGEVVAMNAVNPDHGALSAFLIRLVGGFAEEHDLGSVLPDPVLVRLPRQRRRRSPDLFYYADAKRGQVRDQHFEGPPDLAIEIVSPESRRRDTVEKFQEYEAAGVPEYWLADRPLRTFEAYTLAADGRYARLPEVDGTVRSAVLPGLFFRPEWVWQLRFPKVAPLLAAMAAERARLAGG